MDTKMIFHGICIIAAAVMVIYYISRKRRLLSAAFGVISGLAALFLMNRYGGYMGAELPLTAFNICGSAVLGVPFVAVLVVLKYI